MFRLKRFSGLYVIFFALIMCYCIWVVHRSDLVGSPVLRRINEFYSKPFMISSSPCGWFIFSFYLYCIIGVFVVFLKFDGYWVYLTLCSWFWSCFLQVLVPQINLFIWFSCIDSFFFYYPIFGVIILMASFSLILQIRLLFC